MGCITAFAFMSTVLIFAEYLRSMAWSTTAWIPAIAHALMRQGHTVHVCTDGLEDASAFQQQSGTIHVHVRRPNRKLRASDPLGFARWCKSQLATHPGARSISFTRYFPGDLWIPLGKPIVSTVLHAVRAHRPATAAMEIIHRPWAPKALIAEHFAQSHADRTQARIGVFELPSQSMQPLQRPGEPPEPAWTTPLFMGYASTLIPPSPDASQNDRTRLRRLLGISDSSLVVALSAVHHDRPGIAEFFDGAAATIASHVPPSPDLHILIAGRKTHTLHKLIEAAGISSRTHILGGTARIDAVLAASDLAVATGTRIDTTSTGRFIADALVMGVPVLATPTAPGSQLVRPTPEQSTAAGLIVDFPSSDAWRRALRTAGSPPWRAVASAHAKTLAPALSIDTFTKRLAEALGLDKPASPAAS
jgi:glycosyltransferase involved in cell wall biosynthesis